MALKMCDCSAQKNKGEAHYRTLPSGLIDTRVAGGVFAAAGNQTSMVSNMQKVATMFTKVASDIAIIARSASGSGAVAVF